MSIYDQIVEYFGGKQGLADALGITRQAVSGWNGVIPEERPYQIEVLSNGKFRAADILAAQAEPKKADAA